MNRSPIDVEGEDFKEGEGQIPLEWTPPPPGRLLAWHRLLLSGVLRMPPLPPRDGDCAAEATLDPDRLLGVVITS